MTSLLVYALFFLYTAAAFFIGSIPFGYILGKLKGVDIRTQGSGNTGATNVERVLGRKAGVSTLFLDLLKGSSAVLLAHTFPSEIPFAASSRELGAWLGIAAICGHCFSPFLSFRGGKGVATSLGAFILIAPFEMSIGLLLFFFTVKITRFVSLGSLVAVAAVPSLLLLRGNGGTHNLVSFIAFAGASIIFLRHHANIKRLLSGTEAKYASSHDNGTASSSSA